MYTLYYSPGACSTAIHVALHECGQEVELKKMDLQAGDGQKPEFLKLNPMGQVPVLVDDGQPIREGAAILLHIFEKHDSPLLPKTGAERTKILQWLMFANASLHPAYGTMFMLMKTKTTEGPMFDAAVAKLNRMWASIEQALAAQPYLCGAQPSMADILVTVIANWTPRLPAKIEIGPKTKEMLKKIVARPSYQRVMQEEQTEYKAAA